jgi:hypothetical protein
VTKQVDFRAGSEELRCKGAHVHDALLRIFGFHAGPDDAMGFSSIIETRCEEKSIDERRKKRFT